MIKPLLTYTCAVFLFTPFLTLAAETEKSPIIEYRRHFRIADRSVVLYEVTAIVRMSEEKDENYVLIRDQGHGDFVMSKVWTFENQRSVSRLNDIKNRSFIQASYVLPLVSETRSATMAEARADASLLEVRSVFTLETNGGRWEGLEKDWDDPGRLRQLRHQLRQTLDFSLLEAMERMRGTLFLTDSGDYFYSMVCKFAVYDTTGEDTQQKAGDPSNDVAPDCDFDKHFGFPCSEKQLERLKKAAAEQKTLDRY